MAWRPDMPSMEYDDDEMLDRMMPSQPEPPSFPFGLRFSITEADLKKAGCEDGGIGDTMHFSAMGDVTSVYKDSDGSRIELEIGEFAGEDGKFFDLEQPASICLCGPELEKMHLGDDAEHGDMIHLIGEAKLESLSRNSFAEMATLQIVALTYEDESEESREG